MSTIRTKNIAHPSAEEDQIVLNADGTFGGELNNALASKLDTIAYQPGLVLVTTQSFSAISSLSVNNCFTSTFDHYEILISASGGGGAVLLRLRGSGSDETSNEYHRQRIYGQGSSVLADRNQSTSVEAAVASTQGDTASIKVFNPQKTQRTHISGRFNQSDGSNIFMQIPECELATTTAYDGFSLNLNTGTMSGALRVYGYRN